MKIVISHVYSSNNNGDAAILSAQIDELDRTFSGPQMSIMTVDVVAPGYKFDGVPVINSLMYGSVSPANNIVKKFVLAFAMMLYTALFALVYKTFRRKLPLPDGWRKPLQLLVEADMQVCVGGGYLRAKDNHSSTVILMLMFHQIWLAKLLGKPVYLYAQSFGPYPKKIQYKIASWGLKQADLLLVRESKSFALVKKIGVPRERIFQVPDSAFMFQPKVNPEARKWLGLSSQSSDKIVGVTARTWLPAKEQAQYEQALAAFIDSVSSRPGYKVAIIAQVTLEEQNDDDRVVGRRIYEMCKHKADVVFLDRRFNHYEIKSVFANLTYLIGTRFHSVIFALTAGVPAIAIEYEHKTSGIMQDLDLGHWVIPMEKVTAEGLKRKFAEMLEAAPNYRAHLSRVVPPYMARASDTGAIIQKDYELRVEAGSDLRKLPTE